MPNRKAKTTIGISTMIAGNGLALILDALEKRRDAAA
jgi:hypothetical protein